MKGKYHVLELGSKGAEETIQKFCQTNGQMLLPVVDLITEARLAVDEVIDRAGRGLIETILSMSAEQIAGPKSPGSGEVRWHGRQFWPIASCGWSGPGCAGRAEGKKRCRPTKHCGKARRRARRCSWHC